MLNLKAVLVVMFATSQLMFKLVRSTSKSSDSFCPFLPISSTSSPSPSYPSEATSVRGREFKCLPISVLRRRTREDFCDLAYEWRLWVEVMAWERMWSRIRYVKEIFDIVSFNVVNRNFWRVIVSRLSDSKV